jgi:predicted acetyltransferase
MKLIKLTKDYYKEFVEMATEYADSGDSRYSEYRTIETFKLFLDNLAKFENEETTPKGLVPSISYWLTGEDQKLIGSIRLRTRLNENLLIEGGNIGYDIRPSKRNNGYATLMLELLLIEVKRFGFKKVLVTCSEDNRASEKVIIKNGGIFESIEPSPGNGEMVKRFWISLTKSKEIKAVIFDYGLTIGAEYYFNVQHPDIPNWNEIIQETVFRNKTFIDKWLTGDVSLIDVAKKIEAETKINQNQTLDTLKKGCMNLKENEEVIEFAKELNINNFPIAMVTLNFDIFNEIVIPYHAYDRIFKVIINSCDYNEIDKKKLWPIAFKKLGTEINYENSLLIEDSKYEVDRFVSMGGNAILYHSDTILKEELIKYNF